MQDPYGQHELCPLPVLARRTSPNLRAMGPPVFWLSLFQGPGPAASGCMPLQTPEAKPLPSWANSHSVSPLYPRSHQAGSSLGFYTYSLAWFLRNHVSQPCNKNLPTCTTKVKKAEDGCSSFLLHPRALTDQSSSKWPAHRPSHGTWPDVNPTHGAPGNVL
jgi:hypothetical protein